MITLFHGPSILGPLDKGGPGNPIFTNRDRAEEPLQNIGHSDLFQCCLKYREHARNLRKRRSKLGHHTSRTLPSIIDKRAREYLQLFLHLKKDT